jgi:hypothetical protein
VAETRNVRKRVYSSLQAVSPSAVKQTLARWLAALDAVSRILFSEQDAGRPERRQL